ncbi:MAG: hypothetical protein WKG00_34585 [Polyangiaceae bacterium]
MTELRDRTARRLVIYTMIVGLVLTAMAFAYKIAAFIWTLSSPDFRGTFDVGITVYFVVSAGWLCLLVWAFLTGRLKDVERTKLEMLRQEEEYEKLGI